MTPIRILTLAAAMALTIPTCAAAQTEDKATFDLKIRGLRAGYVSLSAVQSGQSYIASGALKSGGLASLLKNFSYTARSEGSVTRGRYRPAGYAETASSGKKSSKRTIAYSGGKPVSVKTVPARVPKPYDVAPATMSGSVDPMTALYAVLRDVDAARTRKSRPVRCDDVLHENELSIQIDQGANENLIPSREHYKNKHGGTLVALAVRSGIG